MSVAQVDALRYATMANNNCSFLAVTPVTRAQVDGLCCHQLRQYTCCCCIIPQPCSLRLLTCLCSNRGNESVLASQLQWLEMHEAYMWYLRTRLAIPTHYIHHHVMSPWGRCQCHQQWVHAYPLSCNYYAAFVLHNPVYLLCFSASTPPSQQLVPPLPHRSCTFQWAHCHLLHFVVWANLCCPQHLTWVLLLHR